MLYFDPKIIILVNASQLRKKEHSKNQKVEEGVPKTKRHPNLTTRMLFK